MGLSASQARYLSLVARQSNLEYQGQQINQERTILSQQCTELYNYLLDLKVPVPPSTNDFTKVVYSGTDGADRFSLGTIIPTGSSYTINFQYTKTGHYLNEAGTVAVKNSGEGTDGPYYVTSGDKELECINLQLTPEEQEKLDNNEKYIQLGDHTILADTYKNYIQAIRDTYPEYYDEKTYSDKDLAAKFYVYFYTPSGAKSESPRFLEETALKKTLVSGVDGKHYVPVYDYSPNGQFTVEKPITDCKLDFDSAGRIITISIPLKEGTTDEYKTIKLSASTVTDDKAYQDAYAEYEYQQHLYDKEQQELNRKTEIIQQEDRNLELKLTRLDNERKQITTELDAVKKVIDENIDKSYKTFNG